MLSNDTFDDHAPLKQIIAEPARDVLARTLPSIVAMHRKETPRLNGFAFDQAIGPMQSADLTAPSNAAINTMKILQAFAHIDGDQINTEGFQKIRKAA